MSIEDIITQLEKYNLKGKKIIMRIVYEDERLTIPPLESVTIRTNNNTFFITKSEIICDEGNYEEQGVYILYSKGHVRIIHREIEASPYLGRPVAVIIMKLSEVTIHYSRKCYELLGNHCAYLDCRI